LGQWREGNPITFQHRKPPIVCGTLARMRDHSFVLNWMEPLRLKTVVEEGLEHPLDLPGLTRTRGKKLCPGEGEFGERGPIIMQDRWIVRQVHHTPIIVEDRLRPRFDNCYDGGHVYSSPAYGLTVIKNQSTHESHRRTLTPMGPSAISLCIILLLLNH